MQITRNTSETTPGPADWFTGAVFIDAVAAPSAGSRLSAANVHFTPGARTAWHTHPHGQTLHILAGAGRVQKAGGPVQEVLPGDTVWFEPGERHWHGAAPANVMVHLAVQQCDATGSAATWAEHVTDADYEGR